MSHPDADVAYALDPIEAAMAPPEIVPTESDLAPWAKILINDAYLSRPRQKASREDFTQAAIAMLLALRWRAAFLPEIDIRWALGRHNYPLPGLVDAFIAAGPNGEPDLARFYQPDNSGVSR